MCKAVDFSRRCSPSASAYSVGAVIVDNDGRELATGYSRETDPRSHAEEAALRKASAADPVRLRQATLYSTMEPCSARAARRAPCVDLTIAAGICRVVIAWREPSLFVARCEGVERLRRAGVEVTELIEFAEAVREVNSHLDL
jgi:pyrimidine deaminase RibD-like protein